jgi:hypothetical protein
MDVKLFLTDLGHTDILLFVAALNLLPRNAAVLTMSAKKIMTRRDIFRVVSDDGMEAIVRSAFENIEFTFLFSHTYMHSNCVSSVRSK